MGADTNTDALDACHLHVATMAKKNAAKKTPASSVSTRADTAGFSCAPAAARA